MAVSCNLGEELKLGPVKEQCVSPKYRVISPEPGFLSLEFRRCPFADQQRAEVSKLPLSSTFFEPLSVVFVSYEDKGNSHPVHT